MVLLVVLVLVVHVTVARASLPLPHHTNGAMFLTRANEDSVRDTRSLGDAQSTTQTKKRNNHDGANTESPSAARIITSSIRNTLVTLGATLDRYATRLQYLLPLVIRSPAESLVPRRHRLDSGVRCHTSDSSPPVERRYKRPLCVLSVLPYFSFSSFLVVPLVHPDCEPFRPLLSG